MATGKGWWMLPMVLLGAAVPAVAQPVPDAGPGLAGYNLRVWNLVDGAPPEIWALAQSAEGYLLLGTGAGLYRFDGLRFERVLPAQGNFPSNNITSLLALPGGTLWIGFFTGQIARLKDGRLDRFLAGSASPIEQFAQGRDGTIWAARSGPEGGLFHFDQGRWTRISLGDRSADRQLRSVLAARDGSIWAVTDRQLLVRRPGNPSFQPVRPSTGAARVAQAPNGRIWTSAPGKSTPEIGSTPVPPDLAAPIADRMIFGRDGTLWQSAFSGGVLQVRGLAQGSPQLVRLGTAGGLPSPVAVPLLEDREGNVWIGTNLGLVRLRPVSAVTALRLQAKPFAVFEVAATDDGTVYALYRQRLYRARPGEPITLFRTIPGDATVIEAEGRDLIIGLRGGVLRLRGERLERLPLPPIPGDVTSWSRDAAGRPWITVANRGVFTLGKAGWQPAPIASPMPHPGQTHAISGAGAGEWLFAQDRVLRREGAAYRLLPPSAQPEVGHIHLLSFGPAGMLVGGETGLARRRGDRFETLQPRSAPDLVGISGIVQSPDGTVWINTVRGLIQTTARDLDAAFRHAGTPLRLQLFAASDGLPGVAQQDEHRSTAVRGGDGRIWTSNTLGIGWIDPRRIVHNPLPPRVLIRSLTANGVLYETPHALALPAGTANLRIAYTALSLAEAERVRFRYRLIGVDRDWVEAGSAREAYYANLGPGRVRFQVIASNNDGVWNETGASMEFTIAPRFTQTGWFRALAIGLGAGLLWLLYAWRMRELMARGRARAEAKIAERERIARELHDTLLQSMQGLMLRFQAAAYATEPGSRAQALLDSALDRADDVMLEARDRVLALRSITEAGDPQPLIEELARCLAEEGLVVTVMREGPAVRYAPAQLEDILAIVQEALANVRRHAGVATAAVTLRVGRQEIAVEIRDAGRGIPPRILAEGGRPGHFGLQGMRERADALGGLLAIEPGDGGGTLVRLVLPK